MNLNLSTVWRLESQVNSKLRPKLDLSLLMFFFVIHHKPHSKNEAKGGEGLELQFDILSHEESSPIRRRISSIR